MKLLLSAYVSEKLKCRKGQSLSQTGQVFRQSGSNIICATADAEAIRTELKYIGPESKVRAELETLQAQKEFHMIASKLEILKQEDETQLYVPDLEEEPKQ